MTLDHFLSNLQNPEKSRDFNIFKNYTLDNFQKKVEKMGLTLNHTTKNKLPVNENASTKISIVGTNGKGSVAFILSELSSKSDFFQKVGLYTSPHLINKEERICLNSCAIAREKLDNIFEEVLKFYPGILDDLSYFEVFTLLAIYFFRKENCDLEIFEAGLGGKLDATKVVMSEILVVTKIGLDHCAILGDSVEKILHEKLLISNPSTKYLFFYEQNNANLHKIILTYCKKQKIVPFFFKAQFQNTNYLSFNFQFCKFILKNIFELRFPYFQKIDFKITEKDLQIPGRIEILKRDPLILFDNAHNADAIKYLLISIQNLYPNTKFNFLISVLKDKDLGQIIKTLQESNLINDIYYYESTDFLPLSFSNSKIKVLNDSLLRNFFGKIKMPLLVAGSFRLYPIVQKILSDEI